jgi:hypothetical protein
MKVWQLPSPIYGLLRDYLLDYTHTTPWYEARNWRNFLNSSKLLAEIKKDHSYFFLGTEFSLIYWENFSSVVQMHRITPEELFTTIARKIRRPTHQVSLRFHEGDCLPNTTTLLVHTFFLGTFFGKPWLKDVSFLWNVKYVQLPFCDDIQDISPLSSCYFLDLSYCSSNTVNNENLHFLKNVKRLRLGYCKQLTDVSCLENVEVLNLTGCSSLVDVSKLGRVRRLNLSECKKITDVSALHSVYKLQLDRCTGIEDISSLYKVRELNLRGAGSMKTGLPQPNALKELSVLSTELREIRSVMDRFEDVKISIPADVGISGISGIINIEISGTGTSANRLSSSDWTQFPLLKRLTITNFAFLSNQLIFNNFSFLKFLEIRSVSGDHPIVIDSSTIPYLEELYLQEIELETLEVIGKHMKKVTLREVDITSYILRINCSLEKLEITFGKETRSYNDNDLETIIALNMYIVGDIKLFQSSSPHRLQIMTEGITVEKY